VSHPERRVTELADQLDRMAELTVVVLGHVAVPEGEHLAALRAVAECQAFGGSTHRVAQGAR
jgi:hypothetical protein